MSPVEFAALIAAGFAAGTINTVVGSGTLVTFPTLLFFGHPPVTANISNSLGLIPGGLTGSHGYRDELHGHGATLRRRLPMSVAGSAIGALLLLVLPSAVFDAVVPVLIGVAVLLVAFGPWLQRQAARRQLDSDGNRRDLALRASLFVSGVYGGYFGAAQGVLLVGLMSVLTTEPLQRLNATKNVLSAAVNLVAALVFVTVAWHQVNWAVVAAISLGSLVGGYAGAKVGRRLSPPVLRGLIVVIGVGAIARIVVA
ncbi:MAG TPA: sulfite exporter TauE/SafE family protein [Dermatophilaceae bacterium]|nr:sulfite exporter TauE/SafE family protein [Dermatophilaceae bacterium]